MLFLVSSVMALTIEETKEIDIILNVDSVSSNVNQVIDDNVYNVYCENSLSGVCHVYMTGSKHTLLTGD